MEMTKVHSSDHENVNHLKGLIEKAHEHGVAGHYKDHAEKL